VILLVVTTYFLLGSVPLLVLKHDTPLDSRFVRSFFNTYYFAVMLVAGATGLSYAAAGKPVFAASAAALVLLAAVLRGTIISRMDQLQGQMRMNEATAIPAFRRIHMTAIVINMAQLITIVGTLIAVSLQMR